MTIIISSSFSFLFAFLLPCILVPPPLLSLSLSLRCRLVSFTLPATAINHMLWEILIYDLISYYTLTECERAKMPERERGRGEDAAGVRECPIWWAIHTHIVQNTIAKSIHDYCSMFHTYRIMQLFSSSEHIAIWLAHSRSQHLMLTIKMHK